MATRDFFQRKFKSMARKGFELFSSLASSAVREDLLSDGGGKRFFSPVVIHSSVRCTYACVIKALKLTRWALAGLQ